MGILATILLAWMQGEPPSSPPASRVDAYVRQLKDEATRDRARDRLVHLGPAVLGMLERREIDAEVLAQIRREISENTAIGAAYGPPHLFTFDGTEESLGELLSRLETGAGVTFQKNSIDLSQKFSLSMPEATFWEAFDEICKKASLWYFPGEQFYLNAGNASPQPRSFYGPFMIIMERVLQQRKMTFDKTQSEFWIRLVAVWERTVLPLGPTGRYTLLEVKDDTGASLLAKDHPAPPARPNAAIRMSGQRIDLAGLLPPSPTAKKLALVRGTLEVEFPARVDEVRIKIDGSSLPAVREIDGARVELKSLAPAANWGYSAEFELAFKDPKEAASFRVAPSDFEFTAPEGGPGTSWINGTRRDADKGIISFTVMWRPGRMPDPPQELRLRVPRGSLIKNVPFCYRNVDFR